ncbi:tRNA (guanosine(46)-N7)-methyltransferase TrmB [Thermosipho atlanticus]|uniref:tRNA (guanine-N(7)-)-methyltransferase n=1 Tax=Thermosipho atlanticus DSM 15807 TaxID=1123380 RepID=A0A1M5SQ05_9BACT|nr:tRNA (guanosine(46)-N7)-methyltransferase TrmB [Thermosipho atlanticus]SHH40566.1 tRNA (guanine-N(7)-)-methyltransferase [Thermosipho atlanticus DSM 15807]
MVIFPEYELKPQQFHYFPIDWSKIFENSNPIHVEIGFGNGEYAAYYCKQYPEINYIGFELSITSMIKAQKKLKKDNIKNAKLILVDGKFALREFFDEETIEKVIMNFPVPWYKNSQSHRRIILKEFFEILSVVLKNGGCFELVSDQEWYVKEAKENAQSTGYFEVFQIEKNPPREFYTRYEKKWIKFGRDIFKLRIKKIKSGRIERLIGGVQEMPHAKGKIDITKINSLKEAVFKESDKIFIVKGIYKDINSESYVIKIISTDKDFVQHYFLCLYRKDNEWILKLDSESNPYRTPAVKWSVKKIMEVLS